MSPPMTAPSIKEALKPCPFCGSRKVILSHRWDYGFNRRYPYCEGCFARGPSFNKEEEASAWWNTRATFQPDGERREAIAPNIARAIARVQLNGGDPDQPAVRWNGAEMEPQEFSVWRDYIDEAHAVIAALPDILASCFVQDEAGWQPIETAPKDGTRIFVRRDNGCGTDYAVVWWDAEFCDEGYPYPWRTEFNAYADGHWDEWMLPPIRSARDGGAET